MGLITETPVWFIFLCLFLGAGYALLLYFRYSNDLNKWLIGGLFCFRFLSTFLISFLLLSPLVKRTVKTVSKPVIIIGIDHSESIPMSGDSGFSRDTFPGEIHKLKTALEKKFEVKLYSFGEVVREGFSIPYLDRQTDISTFLEEIIARYTNRNIGALVLASDGIWNRGEDPIQVSSRITCPVYTIAIGDTSLKKDILIKNILYIKYVFLDDQFPLEVQILMHKMSGSKSMVTVRQGDHILFTKEIKALGNRYLDKSIVWLEAKQKGIQQYTIEVENVDGEITSVNNRKVVFIEVMEARQKVLILYEAPHPDIYALRAAMSGSNRFVTEIRKTDEMASDFRNYALIIMYQIPGSQNMPYFQDILNSKTPLLFILGTRTNLNTLNQMNTGLIIQSARMSYSESGAQYNPLFTLFTIPETSHELIRNWPPLLSPFGLYQTPPMTDVLFYQVINTTQTRLPLIFFIRQPARKAGFITGENLWRWSIQEYMSTGSRKTFEELIGKIFQYLTMPEDKSFFRVRTASRYDELEPVTFEAELFNHSYEPVNDPDVQLIITDENEKEYPFVFNKTLKSYVLQAGKFIPGNYYYSASVTLGRESYKKSGTFLVTPVNLEEINLTADHRILNRLASMHDGEMIPAREAMSLTQKIMQRDDIHSISSFRKKLNELIGTPWLFILIVTLLTVEWAIRKRQGM